MHNAITSEIVVAYSQCPRKAFLLLCTDEQGMPHEYMRLLEQQKSLNQTNYLSKLNILNQISLEEKSHSFTDLAHEGSLVIKATLKTEGLEAYCDVLTQIGSSLSPSSSSYEPVIVIGTYSISKEQELELVFTGYVLGQMQKKLPVAGHIVRIGDQVDVVKLEPHYKGLNNSLILCKHGLEEHPSIRLLSF